MPDRTLVWGAADDADTKYRTRDDDETGGGNFVVAEDLDGNTVLLQWNPTDGEWQYGGPVDLSGNDINNAGVINSDTINTDDLGINGFSAGDTRALIEAEDTQYGAAIGAQTTSDVSTTGKVVFKPSDLNIGAPTPTKATVIGREEGTANQFISVVTFVGSGAATAHIDANVRDSPPGRNYSVNSNSNLELAMDSGTVNVAVIGTAAGGLP